MLVVLKCEIGIITKELGPKLGLVFNGLNGFFVTCMLKTILNDNFKFKRHLF